MIDCKRIKHGLVKTSLGAMLFFTAASSSAKSICNFTMQEHEFFEFSEEFPFSDKDFAEKSVQQAKATLAKNWNLKSPDYIAEENARLIIEGGRLQAVYLKAKSNWERQRPQKGLKFDAKADELKFDYLLSRKIYCDFQRSHYVLYW